MESRSGSDECVPHPNLFPSSFLTSAHLTRPQAQSTNPLHHGPTSVSPLHSWFLASVCWADLEPLCDPILLACHSLLRGFEMQSF